MKTNVYTKTCTQIFIAALFIRAKKWKQPKCSSTDEWTDTMEYYLAIKRNEILMVLYNIEELQKHSRAIRQDHILYDPMYMKCPE